MANILNSVLGRTFRKWSPIGLRKSHVEHGMTLVEIAIGVALLGLIAAAAIATLLVLNKNAASTRLMTNVREIVQRNIETAVGVPFPDLSTSPPSIPAILATTTSGGAAWNDGTGNPVPIYTSRDGTMNITGTLTRIVTPEPDSLYPAGDDNILRVTFRLTYPLYGRNQSYELTTIRAKDQ